MKKIWFCNMYDRKISQIVLPSSATPDLLPSKMKPTSFKVK